jgi:hypothetical protein
LATPCKNRHNHVRICEIFSIFYFLKKKWIRKGFVSFNFFLPRFVSYFSPKEGMEDMLSVYNIFASSFVLNATFVELGTYCCLLHCLFTKRYRKSTKKNLSKDKILKYFIMTINIYANKFLLIFRISSPNFSLILIKSFFFAKIILLHGNFF